MGLTAELELGFLIGIAKRVHGVPYGPRHGRVDSKGDALSRLRVSNSPISNQAQLPLQHSIILKMLH